MIFLATVLVLTVIACKVAIDRDMWGNVQHGWGLFIVMAILIPFSYLIKTPYPLFLYGTLFNPAIALASGQDFYYIGTTATTDKLINKYLDGRITFWTMASLTFLTLIL